MSADSQNLVEFIRAAKSRQAADDFIVSLLRQNGWSERRIYEAFTAYYESAIGAPIPSRGARTEQARDAFYYLLIFITLGFWTVALVLFADAYVDYAIPSALDNAYAYQSFHETVSWQLASIIVAFPLFLFITALIERQVAQRPETYESDVRKWLTYYALVITAITLISDAVWFLTTYLSGDLTSRFALKALVLFVVAAGVFSYYLTAVKPDARPSPARRRAYTLAASLAVIAALFLGFTAIGGPAAARIMSFDRERISRLQQLSSAIDHYWAATPAAQRKLPATLADLRAIPNSLMSDPATNVLFDYYTNTASSGSAYHLCATFGAPAQNAGEWSHPAGYHRFALDAATDPSSVNFNAVQPVEP